MNLQLWNKLSNVTSKNNFFMICLNLNDLENNDRKAEN